MARNFSTTALTRLSAHHPWRTIIAWGVTLVLAVGIMGLIGMRTTTDFEFVTQPESRLRRPAKRSSSARRG
jgi:hypothetical protein